MLSAKEIVTTRSPGSKEITLWHTLLLSIPIGTASAMAPDVVQGIVIGAFWVAVVATSMFHLSRRLSDESWVARFLFGGLVLRALMVAAHLAVAFWFYGTELDFATYFYQGSIVGQRILEGDWDTTELDPTAAGGKSMITAYHLTALLFFLVGKTLVGQFILSGILGFFGSYLFWRAFLKAFPSCRESRFLAGCLLFFPSLAFWTSLLGKDSWIFFFIGWVTYEVVHVWKACSTRHLLGLAVSMALVTFLRTPVGMALAAAIGIAALLAVRSTLPQVGPSAVLRPIGYVVIGCFAVGSFYLVSSPMRDHPKFSDEVGLASGIVDFAVDYHAGLASDRAGGSTVAGLTVSEKSTSAVAEFLPAAMFTFIFRPFVFEAHNAVAMLAAIDGTVLLFLVVKRRRHLFHAIRSIPRNPLVAFCVMAFLLLTAGLSFETNLGVIVRHRCMVLGFLFVLLAVPCQQAGAPSQREP